MIKVVTGVQVQQGEPVRHAWEAMGNAGDIS